jgi:hypothetical protein
MGCSWLAGVIKQCSVRLWSTLPTVPEPWEIVLLHGRDTLPCMRCDPSGVVVAVRWHQTPGVERHHWGSAWHKEPHVRPENGHDSPYHAPSAVLPCDSPMAACVEAYEGAVSERPSNMLTEEYRRYPKSGQARQGYGMSIPARQQSAIRKRHPMSKKVRGMYRSSSSKATFVPPGGPA